MKTLPAITLALFASAVHAQDQNPGRNIAAPLLEAHADGAIRRLGLRIDADRATAPSPILWRDALSVVGSEYIRLFLRHEGAAFPRDAELLIVPDYGPGETVALRDIGPEGLWTGVVHSGQATLALRAAEPLGGAVLVLDSIAIGMREGADFSTHGRNDLKPIHAAEVPEPLRLQAPAVATLYLIDRGRPARCTGVLIGPDLLLTNEHCISTETHCRDADIVFGYEVGRDGRLNAGTKRKCAGLDPARVSFDLDAAVIRLDRPLGDAFPPVSLAPDDAAPQGDLHIIQHPSGLSKQISYLDCAAISQRVTGRAEQTDFTHSCDTAGGSSGAPVFDARGRLVGLHHFGFLDEDPGGWTENRAVHADLIARWLQAPDQTAARPP